MHILSLMFAAYLGLCSFLYAQPSEEETPEWARAIIYKADQIDFQRKDNVISGQGNVHVSYKGMELWADEVSIDLNDKTAFAFGDVKISQDGKDLTGEEVRYDFSSRTVMVDDLDINAEPWYAKGQDIQRNAESVYISGGSISTCDHDEPHWRLQSNELWIYPGDKIVAKNVAVFIGNIPVFYWPQYVQSLNDRRGKFSFVPGHNSEWGAYLLSSMNYELNPENRGSIHLDFREDRGFAYGLDHVYDQSDVQGVFRAYYLDERDDSVSPRQIDERYRVKWLHKQNFNDNLWAVLEWQELSDGEVTLDYFEDEFHQDPEPQSSAFLQQRYEWGNFSFFAQKQSNQFFDTVERLPELRAHTPHLRVFDTPLYWKNELVMANLNQQLGSLDSSANRADYFTELTGSKKVGIVSIRPYVGMRQTYYSRGLTDDSDQTRGVLYAGVDLKTKLYQKFDVQSDFWQIDGLRLIHEPTISYVYQSDPTTSKDSLIQFDSLDTLEREHFIRFKLENRLQTKRFRKARNMNRNLLQHRAFIDYFPNGRPFAGGGEKDVSEITQEIEFRPFSWLKFDLDSQFDPYERHYTQSRLDVHFDGFERGSVTFGHHYRRDQNSDWTSTLQFHLNDSLRARVLNEYDFESRRMTRQEYSLIQDLHCWTGALTYSEERDDISTEREIWLTFYLNAFTDDPFDYSEGIRGGLN